MVQQDMYQRLTNDRVPWRQKPDLTVVDGPVVAIVQLHNNQTLVLGLGVLHTLPDGAWEQVGVLLAPVGHHTGPYR